MPIQRVSKEKVDGKSDREADIIYVLQMGGIEIDSDDDRVGTGCGQIVRNPVPTASCSPEMRFVSIWETFPWR